MRPVHGHDRLARLGCTNDGVTFEAGEVALQYLHLSVLKLVTLSGCINLPMLWLSQVVDSLHA